MTYSTHDEVVRLRAPSDFKTALAAAACARGVSMSALIRANLEPILAAGADAADAPPVPSAMPSVGRYVFLSGDPRVNAFVAEKTGRAFSRACTSLGVEVDGKVIAGFLFASWTGPDVTLTLAADAVIPRAFLRRVAAYVWGELGCVRATVETDQQHVADLALRMGGKVEGVKRNFYGPGRDATIFGILQEEWFLSRPQRTGGAS